VIVVAGFLVATWVLILNLVDEVRFVTEFIASMEVTYAEQSLEKNRIPDGFGSDRSGYISRDCMWRGEHRCEFYIGKYAWADITADEPDLANEPIGGSRVIHSYRRHDDRTCRSFGDVAV